jgi:hypothetical protein
MSYKNKRSEKTAPMEGCQPTPVLALKWLQSGGGITLQEAIAHREDMQEERNASHERLTMVVADA